MEPGADSLLPEVRERLKSNDERIRNLYDPEKDTGFMGGLKKANQTIQNKGLLADPFAALGLKNEGTEKFVENITGGRVKNLGAKITGLQFAAKGLLGPLGRAFQIDDRGSLGRYLRPGMEKAQSLGLSGVGNNQQFNEGKSATDKTNNYNTLVGDKLANLALGQINFRIDENGRAITSDIFDSNKTAEKYFKTSREELANGNPYGGLFNGLSGVLRVNQNTGWGNLRPGGNDIDLGGGFTPTKSNVKPVQIPDTQLATKEFESGNYAASNKALGGDLSKPVPIPQITQGAIPKPKTNQQKLIEKRPWYDKFGLFGGASRLQKKEGGGMINGSTEKGAGFNLLNPASWFSGDAQKATRGELGPVKDNSLAGKLYNKRRKQEEMMKELGYQSGGYIKENSGMNVLGGADRQKIITQPGEYVLPVDTVMALGGPQKIDRIVADTDSNSSPAKMGLRNKDISEGILPYETQGSGGIDIETLPLSGLGGMGGSSGGLNSPNGTQDEFFSPISSAGLSERQRFMDTIGISAFG